MVRDLVVEIELVLVAVVVVKMVSEVVAVVDSLRTAAPNLGNCRLYREARWLCINH
jgi:hypothetical protein